MSMRKKPEGEDALPLKKGKATGGIDTSASELIEKLRESNSTLDGLVNMSFDASVTLDGLMEACSEAICHTLNVQRAGVWMFSDDRESLIANDIYDFCHMTHAKGTKLSYHNGPKFFNALKNHRKMVVSDISKEKQLADLWKDYFKAHNIHSLLDTPIRSASGLYGFLCIETTDKNKEWTEDDITFTTSIAGLIALAMESKYLRDAHTRIRQMTQYDELTGLGNRSHFLEKMKTFWNMIKSDMTSMHLYFISINEFKQINEQYGHDIGDGLLTMIGQRLSRICQKQASATPFRLGGDEFACLVTGMDKSEANFFGRKLARMIIHPYEAQNRKITVTCSVSCAEADNGISTTQELMSAADLALDTIKKSKEENFANYTAELENTALKKKLLEADLMLAIQNMDSEMDVVVQPVVDSHAHQVVGGELLLRWQNKRLGEFIRPDIFIAMAEDQGLIHLIDTYMLKFALDQVKYWKANYKEHLTLNVNLSPRTLMGTNVIQRLDKILEKKNAPAELVNLEITEGVEMHNEAEMAKIFEEIRKRGPKIYIDDFGSGHTGLSYFTTIPVDAVKVDKCLVEKYLTCPKTKVIISSIIELSRALDIETVLEGIETEEEAAILSQFGGKVKMQGYHFGKPMPVSQFENNFLTKKMKSKSA